jgi:hypothetical protein
MQVMGYNVSIWIIVALAWALNAWWTRRQDRLAEEQRRRNLPYPAPVPSSAPVEEDDRSYAEIQQEIRRKIAERWQSANNSRPPMPSPPMRPAPDPPVPATLPRKIARVPEVMVSVMPILHEELPPASAPMAPPAPSYGASLSARTGPDTVAILQSVLSDQAAARQAFLFREIFDQPLCLRPAGHGGHDGW